MAQIRQTELTGGVIDCQVGRDYEVKRTAAGEGEHNSNQSLVTRSLPSNGRHLSCDDCLDDKSENCQN